MINEEAFSTLALPTVSNKRFNSYTGSRPYNRLILSINYNQTTKLN